MHTRSRWPLEARNLQWDVVTAYLTLFYCYAEATDQDDRRTSPFR